MAKRLSSDGWLSARLAWESDPVLTGEQLAKIIGVTKQAVSARMKRDAAAGDAWTKKVSMREIAERAQTVADRAATPKPKEIPAVEAKVDGKVDRQLPGQFDDVVKEKEAAGTPVTVPPGTPDPVAERASIIARHRREWGVSRGLVGEAVGKRDFERAKLAKITSETLSIIQKGERAAWGLDAADPADKPVVIIERSGAGG